jgi:hypothetical protein
MGTGIGIADIDPGIELMGICIDMGEAVFTSGSWFQAGYITESAEIITVHLKHLKRLR